MAIDISHVDPARTAVVVNECQRGVVGDLGFLKELVALSAPAMANIGRLVRAARPAGIQVVHCVVKGRDDGKGSNTNSRIAAAGRKARESGRVPSYSQEEFADVHEAIGVEPADIVLPRIHGMSPMSDTGLDPLLRNMGITTIVAMGVSLNVGVTNFVMDAMNRSYNVVVPADCCVGVPEQYGKDVLANTIANIARLTTVDELVALWSKT